MLENLAFAAISAACPITLALLAAPTTASVPCSPEPPDRLLSVGRAVPSAQIVARRSFLPINARPPVTRCSVLLRPAVLKPGWLLVGPVAPSLCAHHVAASTGVCARAGTGGVLEAFLLPTRMVWGCCRPRGQLLRRSTVGIELSWGRLHQGFAHQRDPGKGSGGSRAREAVGDGGAGGHPRGIGLGFSSPFPPGS